MNCPESIDWKAYALNEMDAEAKREAAAHLSSCEACREELASEQLTLTALSTLREEEIPRRIAFVSDKVFEPKWWERMFSPTFASACVLAGAIVFHATYAADRGPSEAEIKANIDRTVAEQVEMRTVQYDQMLRMMMPVVKSNMQLVNY